MLQKYCYIASIASIQEEEKKNMKNYSMKRKLVAWWIIQASIIREVTIIMFFMFFFLFLFLFMTLSRMSKEWILSAVAIAFHIHMQTCQFYLLLLYFPAAQFLDWIWIFFIYCFFIFFKDLLLFLNWLDNYEFLVILVFLKECFDYYN